MLKPCVCKDTIYSSEDIGEMPHALLRPSCGFTSKRQTAGEILLRSKDIGGPVQSMAAVIDGAARLGWIMHCAEVLPFRGTHLGACCGRTRWSFTKEGNDQVIDLNHQQAANLVQPQCAINAFRRSSYNRSCFMIESDGSIVLV